MDENERKRVVLTDRELEAMEADIAREVAQLGPPPTVDELRRQGYTESSLLNRTLDGIQGVGRVINLLIAEIIQSIAAVALAAVFAVIEYDRVYNGTIALGQVDIQAKRIAVGVVVANLIVPVFALRQHRGQATYTIVRQTLLGRLKSIGHWFGRDPDEEIVDVYYNPRLNWAAAILTWGTIFLAVYDLLGPLIVSVATGVENEPFLILIIKFIIGLLLSVAGVFYLQSAAHAIGARTLTDNPDRIIDRVESQRSEYQRRVDEIRIAAREHYETVKAERLESRLKTLEARAAPKRLSAGSKTKTDTGIRRNRNARQEFADWFTSQPPEVQDEIQSGLLSLRETGDRAGVDKEIVRRFLKDLKTPNPSSNGHGKPEDE